MGISTMLHVNLRDGLEGPVVVDGMREELLCAEDLM